MENIESKTITVSAELTTEQYNFLVAQQKKHEQELGIEVPIGSMLRKVVDNAMTAEKRAKDDRPPRGDKPAGRPFDKPKFGGGAPRKSFGAPRTGGGPKFSMIGTKRK